MSVCADTKRRGRSEPNALSAKRFRASPGRRGSAEGQSVKRLLADVREAPRRPERDEREVADASIRRDRATRCTATPAWWYATRLRPPRSPRPQAARFGVPRPWIARRRQKYARSQQGRRCSSALMTCSSSLTSSSVQACLAPPTSDRPPAPLFSPFLPLFLSSPPPLEMKSPWAPNFKSHHRVWGC